MISFEEYIKRIDIIHKLYLLEGKDKNIKFGNYLCFFEKTLNNQEPELCIKRKEFIYTNSIIKFMFTDVNTIKHDWNKCNNHNFIIFNAIGDDICYRPNIQEIEYHGKFHQELEKYVDILKLKNTLENKLEDKNEVTTKKVKI